MSVDTKVRLIGKIEAEAVAEWICKKLPYKWDSFFC